MAVVIPDITRPRTLTSVSTGNESNISPLLCARHKVILTMENLITSDGSEHLLAFQDLH